MFELPSFEEAGRFRIIVSTCGAAGSLSHLKPTSTNAANSSSDMSRYAYTFTSSSSSAHSSSNGASAKLLFDLVIIDEASQATEIESYIPLTMCKSDGSGLMVLAGDPQQLGPMTRSPIYGIWNGPSSLQERLLALPLYKFNTTTPAVDTLDHLASPLLSPLSPVSPAIAAPKQQQQQSGSNLVVFLSKNYRSHKVIIDMFSKLFYKHAIEDCASTEVTHSLLPWNALSTNPTFPMLFVGVDGRHSHEVDSPSFHNPEEIDEVIRICKDLLTSTEITVSTKDVGVICAFRSQVLKTRLRLREQGMAGINVGSVEDYQGQEVKVIIITTVLSSRVLSLENKGCLGLWGDRKRFNVAISRGMALCIVVGQPYLLYTDKYWREYITYCYKNHAYQGYQCDLLKKVKRSKLIGGSTVVSYEAGDNGDGGASGVDSVHKQEKEVEEEEGGEGGEGEGEFDAAAHMSVLGGGVGDDVYNNRGSNSIGAYTGSYYNSETVWRVML